LLGAISMCQAGSEIENGVVSAKIDEHGQKIIISRVSTKVVMKEILYRGKVGSFTDIAFGQNDMLCATITAGSPDHMDTTTRQYSIYGNDHEGTCLTQ